MASPLPSTKSHELFPKILGMYRRVGQVPELEVRRWERDLRIQIKANVEPASAWLLLAVTARLRKDVAGVISSLKRAQQYSEESSIALTTLAKIWLDMGHPAIADSLVDRAVQMTLHTGQSLVDSTIHYKMSLQFKKSLTVALKQMERAETTNQINIDFNPASIAYLKDRSAALGINDYGWHRRISRVFDAIREEGFQSYGVALRYLSDDQFFYQIFIDADAVQCAHCNVRIASVLCEEFDEPGAEVMPFLARPLNAYSQVMRPHA